MWKKKREMIQFSGRKHTFLGIISTVIGLCSFVGVITLSILSGIARGNGGLLLGAIGIMLFPLSIFGFVLAYKSCKQKDIYYRFPIAGLVLNGFLSIFLFILYIIGF
ncbi:MAG: putative rane protein [Herbinix sp.]|jgi:hypothetical protein|nr:putative rane protein [Herbinix sp.]